MDGVCYCGHNEEDEHGGDDEYPGSTACNVDGCDCIAFEQDADADHDGTERTAASRATGADVPLRLWRAPTSLSGPPERLRRALRRVERGVRSGGASSDDERDDALPDVRRTLQRALRGRGRAIRTGSTGRTGRRAAVAKN